METMIARKRGFWRSVIGGVMAFVVIAVMLAVVKVLGARGYAFMLGQTYVANLERIAPLTGEWWLMQFCSLMAGGGAGTTAAYWSPPGSWPAPVTVAVSSLLCTTPRAHRDQPSLHAASFCLG